MDEFESEEDDVAQAMGFSTFGGKPPAKRRKVKVDDSSGANSTTLGIRQPRSINPAQGKPEDSERLNDSKHDIPSLNQPAAPSDQDAFDASFNQSNPGKESPQKKKKQAVPTGLAGFLSRGQSIPITASTAAAPSQVEDVVQQPPAPRPVDFANERDRQDPAAPHPVLSKSLDELNQQDLHELRRGVRGSNGEVVFFQQSFIEDPWARLTSERGTDFN